MPDKLFCFLIQAHGLISKFSVLKVEIKAIKNFRLRHHPKSFAAHYNLWKYENYVAIKERFTLNG